jgi:hypothetical protein
VASAWPSNAAAAGKVAIFVGGRINCVNRPAYIAPEPTKKPRPTNAAKPPAPKFDRKYLAAARELRDRYLQQLDDSALTLESRGKYDVSRALAGGALPASRSTLDAHRVAALPAPMAA